MLGLDSGIAMHNLTERTRNFNLNFFFFFNIQSWVQFSNDKERPKCPTTRKKQNHRTGKHVLDHVWLSIPNNFYLI